MAGEMEVDRMRGKIVMRKMIAVLTAVALLTMVLAGCGQSPPAQTPSGDGSATDSRGGVTGAFSVDFCTTPSVYMVDATTGWAVTRTSILRTGDGGANWQQVTPLAPAGTLPGGATAAEAGTPAAGATTWLAGAAFLGAGRGWVALSQESKGVLAVFRTSDGGKNWRKAEVRLRNPQAAPFGACLHFVDTDCGWFLVYNGVAIGRRRYLDRDRVLRQVTSPGPDHFTRDARRYHTPSVVARATRTAGRHHGPNPRALPNAVRIEPRSPKANNHTVSALTAVIRVRASRYWFGAFLSVIGQG